MFVGFMTGTPNSSPIVVLWRSRQSNLRPWFTRHSTYPLHLIVAFLCINQLRQVGLRFVCWFYYGNTQRLTESGFLEKPGIEPATPGLQGIVLIPYIFFVAFLGINQFRRVGLRFMLVLLRGHPRAHRKWVYGEAGNGTCDPWFTRYNAYPLHKLFCGFPGYKPVLPGWFKI